MQVEVTIVSGKNLKNVNWRNGDLKPYAVLWIDSGPKCSSRVDSENDENPMWEEKFSVALPPMSRPETAVLYIDIVHANAPPGTKPLVGSTQLPLREVIDEARSGKVPRSLKVKRPSGRPHGKLEIKIGVKGQMARMDVPYGQQPYYGYPPPPQQAPAYQYQNQYRAPPPPQAAYNSPGYGYSPPMQAYGGGYGPAPVKEKKDKDKKFGAPPMQAYGPLVQGYSGGYGPAPVKQKDKDSKYGVGTGLAVGAAAGLIGGLVIAEGVEALANNNNQAPVIVENVQYVNETNVYETDNTYVSTNVYESNDTYVTTNDYNDDGAYDDGGDDAGW